MATSVVLIPVEEYLSTVYEPDVDYVDGEIQERNMGEQEHATILGFFYFFLKLRENEWKTRVMQEARIQTAST